jgi:hypothetical protein
MISTFILLALLSACSNTESCLTKDERVEPQPGADEICDPTAAQPCADGQQCIEVSYSLTYASAGGDYAAPDLYLCLADCEDGPTDCPSPGGGIVSDCGPDNLPGECVSGHCYSSKAYRWDDELGWIVRDI